MFWRKGSHCEAFSHEKKKKLKGQKDNNEDISHILSYLITLFGPT